MSCDNEFDRYLSWATGDSRVAQAFGSSDMAKDALLAIYTATNALAVRDGWADDRNSTASATAGAMLLFGGMRGAGVTPPIKPPTHAKSGMPTSQTAFGYNEVYTALQAAKRGDELPVSAKNWISSHNASEQDFASLVDDGKWRAFHGATGLVFEIGNSAFTPMTDDTNPDSPRFGGCEGELRYEPGRTPVAEVQIRSHKSGNFSGYVVVDRDAFIHVALGTYTIGGCSDMAYDINAKLPIEILQANEEIYDDAMLTISTLKQLSPETTNIIKDANHAFKVGHANEWNAQYSVAIANPVQTEWSLACFSDQLFSTALRYISASARDPIVRETAEKALLSSQKQRERLQPLFGKP